MWSRTKKRIENIICDSLRDRVEFHCSNYRIHDGIGRTYITVDKKEVYNMCTLKKDYYRTPREGIYSQVEFIETLNIYLSSKIDDCIDSQNPLVKILLILDRRVGKRRLIKMKDNIKNEEEIVKYFYDLRCESEKLSLIDD